MSHSKAAALLGIVSVGSLVACAEHHRSRSMGSNPADAPAVEIMDDQFETPPPHNTVSEVMQSKLAHAQAILEGLALADHAQIETNARALKDISRSADWLAHESTEYFEFSLEFREICDSLITHAHAQNMQSVMRDYADLTTSCVSCHEYLRKQRQAKDMPGRVSMVGR